MAPANQEEERIETKSTEREIKNNYKNPVVHKPNQLDQKQQATKKMKVFETVY